MDAINQVYGIVKSQTSLQILKKIFFKSAIRKFVAFLFVFSWMAFFIEGFYYNGGIWYPVALSSYALMYRLVIVTFIKNDYPFLYNSYPVYTKIFLHEYGLIKAYDIGQILQERNYLNYEYVTSVTSVISGYDRIIMKNFF